jgi:hypothetical protein
MEDDMFKKIVLSLVAAILIAVSFSGPALAAEGDDDGLLRARGKVTDVNTSAGKFSIQTPEGDQLRLFVDEKTRYAGQIGSLEDLEVGMGAGVAYKEHSEGKLVVVGLVAGHAPDLNKIRGEVTAVDSQLGKFEIVTTDGGRMRFFVDENTRYQGQLSSLDELRVGWQAGVASKEGENGKQITVLLIAGIRPEVIRAQGSIVGVDPAAGKFRLEKTDGEVLTFWVDEDTNFRGQVSSIADLEKGFRAGVVGSMNSEEQLIARVVVAGEIPEERPVIVRGQGSIRTFSPGAGKFQLEKSDGSMVTVYVDNMTAYRGQLNGFSDLEQGMRAGFIGYLNNDGKVIARVVGAGKPPSDRPSLERPGPENGLLGGVGPLPPSS